MEGMFAQILVHVAFVSILFVSVIAVLYGVRKPHYFSVICFSGTFLFASSYYILTLLGSFFWSAVVAAIGVGLVLLAAVMNGRAPGVRRRKTA